LKGGNASYSEQTERFLAPMTNVLVVDDDAAVRRFVTANLKAEGFHVVEAENGAAALLALARPEEPIRLVVSDIRMEGLDGISLFERAAEIIDSIGFIFITGFAENERLVSVPTRFPVITKPFSPQALMSCVRLVLSKENDKHGRGE
jgi:DNA-binding NtrC family response regulator